LGVDCFWRNSFRSWMEKESSLSLITGGMSPGGGVQLDRMYSLDGRRE